MAQGGPRAAVPLQRGLARILLASGDRPAAIEAYRGILNVEPDGASDRVALAEIYAVDDPQRAIGELRKVLDRDIHHAPAYRLLASFYSRTGDIERANRVLTALDLLGFAEETDRADDAAPARRARQPRRCAARSTTSTASACCSRRAAREPLGEVFDAFAEELVGDRRAAVARREPAARAAGSEPRLVAARRRDRRAVRDRRRDLRRREGARARRGHRVPAPARSSIDRSLLGEPELRAALPVRLRVRGDPRRLRDAAAARRAPAPRARRSCCAPARRPRPS